MGTVTERAQRRWLVKNPPEHLQVFLLRQGYTLGTITDWYLGSLAQGNSVTTRLRSRGFDQNKYRLLLSIIQPLAKQHGLHRITTTQLDQIPDIQDRTTQAGVPRIEKVRCESRIENYRVDIYSYPADGLVIIECDTNHHDSPPDWAKDWDPRDVTYSFSAAQLANMPEVVAADNPIQSVATQFGDIPMIAVTGAPVSGKTDLMQHFMNDPRVHVVLEAATFAIAKLKCPPGNTAESILRFQRYLRTMQIQHENMVLAEARAQGKSVILLDRATIDAIPYFPPGHTFHSIFGVDPIHDMRRYKAVLQLEVAPEEVYERVRGNNSARPEHETYPYAIKLQNGLLEGWKHHPNKVFVKNTKKGWEGKLAEAIAFVESQIPR